MTAINAVSSPNAVWLLTDTAVYDEDLMVVGFSTKVTLLPHLGMAIAKSGAIKQHAALVDGFMEFSSFDDFVDRGEAKFRDLWEDEHFRLYGHDEDCDHFRLVTIGWSDREKCAQIYVMCTEAQQNIEAFKLDTAPIAIHPGVHPRVLEEAGLTVDGLPRGEPEEWLGRLVDLQRARRCGHRNAPMTYDELPAESGGYKVGGAAAVLTKLTRHGITQRVIRRWPDKLNCKIEIEAREAAQ
jgi:hypothetical protein